MPNENPSAEAEVESNEDALDESRQGRAFWSGMLTFGLVSIPVDLLPATRQVSTRLRMLGNAGKQVERRYYCPEHDEDVPREHIVRGYETSEGNYVPITDEELDALDPKKSREIDLRLFVPKDSVPPLYFDRSHFLVPSAESGKAYALLTQALEARNGAGIATFVMRDREYWVSIFAAGGLLRAQTLRFREYVRSPEDVGLPATEDPPSERVKTILKLMKELQAKELPISELEDEYATSLAKLAEAKHRAGKDVVQAEVPEAAASQSNVIDLIEVLKQRLAESGFDVKGSPANDAVPPVAPKTTAPQKTTARKKATAPPKATPPAATKPGVRKATSRGSKSDADEPARASVRKANATKRATVSHETKAATRKKAAR